MLLLGHCRRCQRLSNECTAEANGQRQHGWAPQLRLGLGLELSALTVPDPLTNRLPLFDNENKKK